MGRISRRVGDLSRSASMLAEAPHPTSSVHQRRRGRAWSPAFEPSMLPLGRVGGGILGSPKLDCRSGRRIGQVVHRSRVAYPYHFGNQQLGVSLQPPNIQVTAPRSPPLPFGLEYCSFSPLGFKGNLSLLDIFFSFSRGRKSKWMPFWKMENGPLPPSPLKGRVFSSHAGGGTRRSPPRSGPAPMPWAWAWVKRHQPNRRRKNPAWLKDRFSSKKAAFA